MAASESFAVTFKALPETVEAAESGTGADVAVNANVAHQVALPNQEVRQQTDLQARSKVKAATASCVQLITRFAYEVGQKNIAELKECLEAARSLPHGSRQ